MAAKLRSGPGFQVREPTPILNDPRFKLIYRKLVRAISLNMDSSESERRVRSYFRQPLAKLNAIRRASSSLHLEPSE
jgi:hypothetical protein